MSSVLYADVIIKNANIETVTRGRASALAVRDGVIVAVGRPDEVLPFAGPKTQIEDLHGKTVLPGFVDAHMHLVSVGLRESGYYLDLGEAQSLSEALERVRERVKKTEEAHWVLGRGWDESRWPERRYITKADLDRIAPEHPVVLIRVCGHILCANTRALQKLLVTPRAGEFDESLGLLREETAWHFLQKLQPSDEQLQAAILAGVKLAHRLGVTAIHDIAKPEHIRAYMALTSPSGHPSPVGHYGRGAGGEGLALRVRLNIEVQHLEHLIALGLRSGFGDDTLKLGAIKFFADGSIGARNAALHRSYRDADGFGKLNYEQNDLNRLVQRAHDHGFQVMIHAIGDRAIDASLEALSYAGATPDRRHRIEHVELVTPQQLERMKELGIIASMQPNFVQWSGSGGLYETRLGPERDAQIDPHRKVLESGVKLAFGSDGMPFGPLYGIHCAVHAPHPYQRVSLEEALRAYTLDAAYAGFEERSLGSLEPGKRADFVVLSEDPTHTKGINEIRVERTYLDGRCVYGGA